MWPALLEKAYAKIHGCTYENLEGGFTSDALIDMTGGIEETLALNRKQDEKEKTKIWKILSRSRQLKSLNACYIEQSDEEVNNFKMSNGLVKGHAYSITKIASVYSVRGNREIRLIRLRNPWGTTEWNGKWSDQSREWLWLSDKEKENLEYKNLNEGEFWMSFDDFYNEFDTIQFCHLSPDSYSDEILAKQDNDTITNNDRIYWKLIAYHDEWIRDKSAGGCGSGNNSMLYWTNPQFLIKLIETDLNDKKCTIIVSLMQKYTREKRLLNNGRPAEEFMQFRLFRILNENDVREAMQTGKKLIGNQLERVDNSGDYVNKRDIVKRFRVLPGDYLIVPSLYEANKEGQFLLKIFSEQKIRRQNMNILNEHNILINSQIIETTNDDNIKVNVKKQYGALDDDFNLDNIRKKAINLELKKNKKLILVYVK